MPTELSIYWVYRTLWLWWNAELLVSDSVSWNYRRMLETNKNSHFTGSLEPNLFTEHTEVSSAPKVIKCWILSYQPENSATQMVIYSGPECFLFSHTSQHTPAWIMPALSIWFKRISRIIRCASIKIELRTKPRHAWLRSRKSSNVLSGIKYKWSLVFKIRWMLALPSRSKRGRRSGDTTTQTGSNMSGLPHEYISIKQNPPLKKTLFDQRVSRSLGYDYLTCYISLISEADKYCFEIRRIIILELNKHAVT